MQILIKITKIIDTFIDWSGKIVCWLFLALMFLAVFEVVTRRLLGAPTIWTFELSGFLLAGVTMLAIGYTQLHHGHVNIDFLYGRFSRRTKAVIDIITFFPFLGFFCYILLTDGTNFAATSWALKEMASTAWSPIIYPVKTVIPVGGALLALVAISQLIKNILITVKGTDYD